MNMFEVLTSKREQIMAAAVKHKIISIRVFGSVARGEENSDSDIDFLVSCKEDCSLFDIVNMKIDLENMLGRKVDVVTECSLNKYLRDGILKEARFL